MTIKPFRAPAAMAALALLAASPAIAQPARPMTVRDMIETRQLLGWCGAADPICRSPDGSRYLAIAATGDVAKNGIRVEFLTGKTESLDAARPRVAARLFTSAYGNTPVVLLNRIAWLADGRRVAFLWESADGVKQVASLDLDTGAFRILTHSPTDVEVFAIDRGGTKLAYVAQGPRDLERVAEMRSRGFAIGRADSYNFFDGAIDGWKRQDHLQLFVADTRNRSARQIPTGSVRGARWPGTMQFSARGDLIVSLPRDGVEPGWKLYSSPWMRSVGLPEASADPLRSEIYQYMIVDAETGKPRRLWEAPLPLDRVQGAVFSPDGSSVVLGSSVVPAQGADAAGLAGDALVEVDVRTGAYRRLPVPPEMAGRMLVPVRWVGDAVEYDSFPASGLGLWFAKRDGIWHRLDKPPLDAAPPPRGIRIAVEQAPNVPPSVIAADGAGNSRTLFDIDPGLAARFRLGRVEPIEWASPDGIKWKGLLYYPAEYRQGTRYPLVIQTHGYSSTDFSLVGDDHFTSVFAAQPLAGRGIAVVQMDGPVRGQAGGRPTGAAREGPTMAAGMEGAARMLVERGIVDGARVGLSGFSRTGWHVEYALTHSDFPYAAAIVADNIDSSYLQSAYMDWPRETVGTNGGEPFGKGLGAWLTEAPGFNADRVRTPLRMQVNSGSGPGWALSHWEMFSRLRHLKLPVELYIVPDMGRGTHNLQNPKQRLASAGGAVDWYDFWLNGREDPDPGKAEQYARWRELRVQQRAAAATPRPPLLEWTSAPKG